MALEQILQASRNLRLHEKRVINDDYCELVIYNDEIMEWNDILTGILGTARKPKGVKPTSGDLALTKASGGIRIEQTLFEKKFNGFTLIAKFWPWGDNVHTTLKMALLPEV